MRVVPFEAWLEASPLRSVPFYYRESARDYRVAKHNYRAEVLLPAFTEIRANGRGGKAHELEGEYRAVRDTSRDFLLMEMITYVKKVNAELNSIAGTESAAYPQCVGVALPILQHSLLPAYTTPRGWMTAQAAAAASGDQDIAAIRAVFERNTGGMRSAPAEGYPHFHVGGLASRVMSIAPPDDMPQKPMPPNRILAFTKHIDSTSPGRTEQGIVNTAVNGARLNGWVWVAVADKKLYRIIHP